MIRVVVDANVLVSAALARDPRAPSVLVLDAVIDERLDLVLSPTLLAEITSVLSRPRLRRYVSEADAMRFVEDLAALASRTPDAPTPYPAVCRDPDDDYLIALARSAGAKAIVTGDRDLLDLEDLRPPVITPRDLVARLDG